MFASNAQPFDAGARHLQFLAATIVASGRDADETIAFERQDVDPLDIALIYLLQLLAFIMSGTILSLPALRFRIVPKRAMHDRAHVEAIRQFLAQGIHLTEHRTGVLIFVSVGKHHAEIVADSAINAKVTPEVWRDAVNATVEAIKHGHPADGLIAAVERCGTVLVEHFPPGTNNRDELPNKVVEM